MSDLICNFLVGECAGRANGQSGTDQPAWFTDESGLLHLNGHFRDMAREP